MLCMTSLGNLLHYLTDLIVKKLPYIQSRILFFHLSAHYLLCFHHALLWRSLLHLYDGFPVDIRISFVRFPKAIALPGETNPVLPIPAHKIVFQPSDHPVARWTCSSFCLSCIVCHKTGLMRIIILLDLQPVLLLTQLRMLLSTFVGGHFWLTFSLMSSRITRSFLAELFLQPVIPEPIFLSGRIFHLSLLNFMELKTNKQTNIQKPKTKQIKQNKQMY